MHSTMRLCNYSAPPPQASQDSQIQNPSQKWANKVFRIYFEEIKSIACTGVLYTKVRSIIIIYITMMMNSTFSHMPINQQINSISSVKQNLKNIHKHIAFNHWGKR